MSRPSVLKQVELPSGTTPVVATARLRLIAAVTGDAFGYAGTANVDVGGTWSVRADNTGLITFTNVRPNSGASADVITSPANTVYEMSTTLPDRRTLVEYLSVPDVAGPVYVQDILTSAPTSLPSGSGTDANAVHLTGDETVAGVKTFTSAPAVPDGSWTIGKTTGLQSALDAKMRRYTATVGDGSSVTLTVTHSLATVDVATQVRDAATGARVDCDVTNTDANTVTLGPFLAAPAASSLKVVVIG